MRILEHNLDGVLVISIVFDNQDDIESIRAYIGGSMVESIILGSQTPSAPSEPAKVLAGQALAILEPLSKLRRKARYT